MRKSLGIVILISFCFFSCSKKGDHLAQPGGGGNGYGFTGNIIFNWATDGILKINLATGKGSTVLPENTGRYGWDISMDGSLLLQSTDAPSSVNNWEEANLYTLSKLSDGTIVSQFVYYPANGDLTNGYLSADKSMIAVQPTFDDGIVILDINGKQLHDLTGFAGQTFGHDTQIAWMPDNSLLFTIGESIYRTNTDFTKATLIKTLNFTSWGDMSVSADGKKIAFDGGNHIWMMNSDGSNLVQVTTSDNVEKTSAFSPDGKYLLIGTDWHQTGSFGSIWYLAIIPADGQTYNVNKGADKRVIFIKDSEGADGGQACDGYMEWR